MNRLISSGTAALYQSLVKPLMFRRKPDAVHARLLKTGGFVQRSGFLRSVLHYSWAYENETVLSQTIHGTRFPNPVGLSAGFDKNFELIPLMRAVGFGFMEGGSLTLQPTTGNPRPWFYRLPNTKSLVVHVGLANEGVHRIIDRVQHYSPTLYHTMPLNVSVAKTNSPDAVSEEDAIADYCGSLVELEKNHIGDMYTLNISCPNAYGGEPFTTPKKLENLLTSVDRLQLTKPLYLKMPIDQEWIKFKKLVEVADKHRIAGLTIGNLAKNRQAAGLRDELPDSVKGNLSGKPTQALSDELIRQTYLNFTDRFVIIGVGGIFSAEDAYRKIGYGANMVELITGMIFCGPQLIGQINRDLVHLLKADGYASIQEAVGARAHTPDKI